MKTRYYIATGISAYLIFLIASIPAAPVLAQLQKQVPELSIQGVSGILWNGSAQSITINRQHTLNDTDWQLNAWRLLRGELGVHITAQYQQQAVNADIGASLSGSLTARNVNASLPAASVAQLVRMPLGEFGGNVKLQLETLEWRRQQVPRAIGKLLWNTATISVAETADLGNIVIVLSENDSHPLTGSINNQGGQVKLEGKAEVGDDGNYTLQLNLIPEKTASNNIRSSLGMIARPQPNGSFQINNNGNLKQFGLI